MLILERIAILVATNIPTMIIGDLNRFGLEIISEDLSNDFAELYICIAGHRVCSQVHLPTFVYYLKGFFNSQQKPPPSNYDFAHLSHEAAFHLLQQVFSQQRELPGLTNEQVWNYFALHSLDDAVDDFEIFVYDVQDHKHLVCRRKLTLEIWAAVTPRHEFLHTLEQFLMLFPEQVKVIRKSGSFQEGDFFEIPLPDGRVALGWLLQVFRQSKDLASFVVLGIQGEIHADEIFSQDFERSWPTTILGPLSTSIDALAQHHCLALTHHPVPAAKQQSEMVIDPISVLEMSAIHRKIEQAFGKAS